MNRSGISGNGKDWKKKKQKVRGKRRKHEFQPHNETLIRGYKFSLFQVGISNLDFGEHKTILKRDASLFSTNQLWGTMGFVVMFFI